MVPNLKSFSQMQFLLYKRLGLYHQRGRHLFRDVMDMEFRTDIKICITISNHSNHYIGS
jgi:hypothetical protein